MTWSRLAVAVCTCLVAGAMPTAVLAVDDEDHERPAGVEREGPEILIERSRWFAEHRAGPDGRVPADGRNRAQAQLRENIAKGLLRAHPEQRIAGDGWSPLGPAPELDGTYSFSGRVTSIAIHPTNANIAYVGGAQGGVWKTTDHGATWTPLTDTQASLAIGAVAIAPSNGNVIYAGTGEANESCDCYFGAGILRSTDAGAHWSLLGATPFAGTSVSRILVHPANPNILWASNSSGVGGFLCSGASGTFGVWRSTDGGVSWLQVLGSAQIGSNSVATDLAPDPVNPNIIYAGINHSGVWKTTNGGTSWVKLAGGLPSSSSIGRVAIAVDPVTAATVYATFEAASSGSQFNTYRSTNSGTSWTAVTKPSGACQYWTFQDACTYQGSGSGQCWYDLVIGVAPDHGVWLGGTGVWRSGDSGTSWSAVCPQSVHADQHALAFKGPEVWLGNDGGVFTTTTNGAAWTSKNPGLALTQLYPGGSVDPTNGDRAMAGAQDNGVLRYSGTASWQLQLTGDGTYTAISADSPNTVWLGATQYLNIARTINGGVSWLNGTAGLTDAGTTAAGFVAPFVMCPNDSLVLIAGSNNVWRTDNGAASWSSNGPEGSTIYGLAFAASTGHCDTYFSIDASGRVFRTTNEGGSWSDASGDLPPSLLSDIAVDPTNAAIVVVGIGGFSGPHIYRTTNALDPSPSWSPIDPGIPNTPVNAVLIDPDNPNVIYAGTDVGIFRSVDSGGSWEVFMGGHPNVAVFDLVASSATGTIVSFTHGRGAFKLGTFCNDQDQCTADKYDQILGCIHTVLDCSDADPCTADACDPGSGCRNTPVICVPVDACHNAACDSATGDCNSTERPDGAPCDDADACTQTDSCQSGACLGGNPVPAPALVDDGVRVDRSGTDALVNWNLAVGASASDVLRGALDAFPVGPGAAEESCLGTIAGTAATDTDVPPEGAGFWYVVRGVNDCAGAGSYGFEERNGAPAAQRVSTTCP